MAMILEHVNYSYGVGTGKEFHALKDINLQIGDHEFIGLVGHSGSGKSTLIQLMNGLLRATEGTIYWDGQDIYDKSFSMESAWTSWASVSVSGISAFCGVCYCGCRIWS